MTLEKLAALAHVSVSTASRALNDGYGISPATRAQVLHVAEQCGYHDLSVFYRSFKSVMGFPPSKLKKAGDYEPPIPDENT